MACNWKVRYCPKCGHIEPLNLGKTCDYCNTLLQETEYILEDVTEQGRGKIKPEIRKVIFEKYIKDNPMYSEEAVKQREEKEYRNRLNMPSSYKSKESNQVKCPFCKSTNVTKISTVGRIVSVGLFGLGSKKIGKQWHCNNCKSDF